jgi:hypothetical protein
MDFALLDYLWLCSYHICYLTEYNLCLVVLLDVLCCVISMFIISHKNPVSRGPIAQDANDECFGV